MQRPVGRPYDSTVDLTRTWKRNNDKTWVWRTSPDSGNGAVYVHDPTKLKAAFNLLHDRIDFYINIWELVTDGSMV